MDMTRREQEIVEKYRPFDLRCEELVERAHAAGVPDTKYLPRKGVDSHWFNHNGGGLVEINERYHPVDQLLMGRLSELFCDISFSMQLREMDDRDWSDNLDFYLKQLKLWIKELNAAGAPDKDMRFLERLLGRLISVSAKRSR